ncbi:toll/interleukin-1 receptor domain-containing protein [Mesonia aestuariivivens]|uniref:Toll/interleukin-1 receptor domain-containing protein n=1 Tax=Mesonia aestuariivivens TaxID=2796128 RepID=A0ABS6W500_9FLAO|nr:toll/interleukin-1 receptor domain-containing protein [Mesonia aestuariivivens]MBW2962930.1 toll/interleukin-1 receptor domain-containing protein [Mesonia aestuariivivens]
MARCTAPINGHRSASARANCPACGSRSRSYGYGYSYSQPYSSSSYRSSSSNNNNGKRKASWSSSGSTVLYTPAEIRTLTPVRKNVEERLEKPDLRDIFLCHAWDDRKGAAKELHDLLEFKGVSVWFSEKDVALGSPLMREIDKGLIKSRVGIVLVTPLFLKRIEGAGIADKELSALLARDLIVPIVHNTTYENLRDASPLLGSRSGLSTIEDSMEEIASKLTELVTPETVESY